MAGLIPYEDKLAMISHSTKCSEGVADLVQILFLVSDSGVLVSDSLLLIRGQFLIRGLFHYKWPCSIAMLNYERANKT